MAEAVDCVCVRGAGAPPLLLARVRRDDGAVLALKNQLAAAGLLDERALQENGVDAQPNELAALKALPQGAALPQRCLDAALVDVRRLAKRSKSGQLDIVLARMLFASIQPLPASLPECGKKRGALRAREVC